jgi:lipopolysaccharide transport system ATP-binding protein
MSDEVLISAEKVSKKFCRSLKRSLWYGVQDVASALNPFGEQRTADTGQGTATVNSSPSTNLRKDEFWAVRDISFELRRGECLGLIGHNGAGKSTLLKILNGLMRPDTGRITMKGRVAALIELNAGFNPILTGRENIFNQAALIGFTREETLRKFDQIVEFAEIGDFLDMPVQNYSSGMKVRLGFAVAAQMEPDILIIDEVLAVGDVAFRFKCLNAMAAIMERSAVIFVSHTMPMIYRVSTHALVLHKGQAEYSGACVAEGITKYYFLQKASSFRSRDTDHITIESCVLSDHNGEPEKESSISLVPGKPFLLDIQILIKSPVKSALVQALIWDQEMLPVAEITTDTGRGFLAHADGQDGRAKLRVEIPGLPLNGGSYSLSVNIGSEDYSRVYCRYDSETKIVVPGANVSSAHFIVASQWSQLGAPKEPVGVL